MWIFKASNLKKIWGISFILFLVSLIHAFIPTVRIVLFGVIIERILSGETSRLAETVLLFIACSILDQLLPSLVSIINNKLRIEISNGGKKLFIEKFTSLSYQKLMNPEWMKKAELAKEAMERGHRLFILAFDVLRTAVTVISLIVTLWTISLMGGVIILLTFSVILAKQLMAGKSFISLENSLVHEKMHERNYKEMLYNPEYAFERKVYRYEPYMKSLWEKYYNVLAQRRLSFNLKANRQAVLLQGGQLLLVFGIYIATILVSTISLSQFVMTYQIVNEVIGRSNSLVMEIRLLYQEMLAAKNIKAFIELDSQSVKAEDTSAPSREHTSDKTSMEQVQQEPAMLRLGIESLELKGVTFSYPSASEEVLKGINMDVRKGEVIGIVGLNGAGKTTISNIIAGLLTPSGGSVIVNGKHSCDHDERREKISVAYLDYGKYPLTAAENIAFSEPVTDVAKRMAQDIMQRSEHRIIGKGFSDSVELSGGQWQRIAIARALNKSADVVILDEPTASLDPITEQEVLKQVLSSAQEGTSFIVIAHRTSAVMNCDRVYVLENGVMVEEGKPKELLAGVGVFNSLYQAQVELLNV